MSRFCSHQISAFYALELFSMFLPQLSCMLCCIHHSNISLQLVANMQCVLWWSGSPNNVGLRQQSSTLLICGWKCFKNFSYQKCIWWVTNKIFFQSFVLKHIVTLLKKKNKSYSNMYKSWMNYFGLSCHPNRSH